MGLFSYQLGFALVVLCVMGSIHLATLTYLEWANYFEKPKRHQRLVDMMRGQSANKNN